MTAAGKKRPRPGLPTSSPRLRRAGHGLSDCELDARLLNIAAELILVGLPGLACTVQRLRRRLGFIRCGDVL